MAKINSKRTSKLNNSLSVEKKFIPIRFLSQSYFTSLCMSLKKSSAHHLHILAQKKWSSMDYIRSSMERESETRETARVTGNFPLDHF